MAIVAQYSKTLATKGRNTLLPHILDTFCQELMKIVVFQAHPFAQQIIAILFPGRKELLTTWQTNLFINFDRLFMTEDLSGVLKATTLKAMEVRIGIRDYRQLSVCVRCAYCPKLDELTASRDDKDPASL